jgi:diguanylate cyclase (GGDEF)-like protein/PAS domain S-box-containing protein
LQSADALDPGLLFQRLLDGVGDSVYVKDTRHQIIYASRAMARNLGFDDPAELIGMDDLGLFGREFAQRTQLEERRIMDGGEPITGLIERRALDGGRINWTLTSKFALRDADGKVVGVMGITREINELKQAETALQHLATHDPLTGLPNRFLMMDRLGQMLARAERHGSTFAVLFIDIDDFKSVNDEYGHAIGDSVLRAMGQRLQRTLRASDTVARLAGDEFVALVDGVDRGAAALIAEKLRHAAAGPIRIGGGQFRVTVSVGVSIFPEHGTDAERLLCAADEHMYQAKKAGKDTYLLGPASAA